MRFFKKQKKLKFFLLIIFVLVGLGFFLVERVPVKAPKVYGVTFAPLAAEAFGLDPKKIYQAVLDDLGFRHIRIAAYWNRVEREKGKYDFSELDWQVHEAEKRNASLIFVVGKKVPRWPECHIPDWASKLSHEEQDRALLEYVPHVVDRYKNSPAIKVWQVENEPFLPFGECVHLSSSVIDREIALVRSLDPSRPILVTDSGEISDWYRAASRGDIFGSTMYQRVVSKYFGAIDYHLPPWHFRLKRGLIELFVDKKPMIVTELGTEPWLTKPVEQATIEEQYTRMDPAYFQDTLEYASRTGFDTFYLWGVEWWYWLREHGHPEIWNIMKARLSKNKGI